MKILFCLLHFGYERNFESVIRELAARGHAIHVGVERAGREDAAWAVVESIAREYPGVTLGQLPEREDDGWRRLLRALRLGADYLRYLQPAYREMPGLRQRAEERAADGLLRLLSWPGVRSPAGRRLVRAALHGLERAVPASPAIEQYLRAASPDVLLITPLIGVVASSQVDYLSTARRLGIPSGFCVSSWDNLSSKALIRDMPDALFVWNETQRDEATRFHHVPRDRIVVTGAQCYDGWFGREPSRSRAEFCASVGLCPDRPYVLYVCSNMVWRSPPEAGFVLRWIGHLRGSPDPRLREAAVLIRPHPTRLEEWAGVDLGRFAHVAFAGVNPFDAAAKADYFDALYYSQAVVGINTSAFIEAGVVGRPVYAILTPEYAGTQEGTIHFKYLVEIGGGIARAGRGLDEHAAQLAEALSGTAAHEERRRRFLEAFVRPHGLHAAATPIFADAVEALERQRAPAASGSRGGAVAMRWAVLGLARLSTTRAGRRWLKTRREVNEARLRRGEKPLAPSVGEGRRDAAYGVAPLRPGPSAASAGESAHGSASGPAARDIMR